MSIISLGFAFLFIKAKKTSIGKAACSPKLTISLLVFSLIKGVHTPKREFEPLIIIILGLVIVLIYCSLMVIASFIQYSAGI